MCYVQLAIAAVAAVGAYSSSQSQKASANYQSQVAANNAKSSELAAQDALQRGEQAKQGVRRKYDQLAGSQRVKMAARGIDLTEGSALSILEDTHFFSEADQATVMDNANREAWGMRVQGANYSAESGLRSSQANGINPLLAGTMGGVSGYYDSGGTTESLITGATAISQKWYGAKRRREGNNPSAYNPNITGWD